MKTIGILLLVLGMIGALFFFAMFDTSVSVPETGDRVNNVGLLNTRQGGIIISMVVVLIGVMLLIADALKPKEKPVSFAPSPGEYQFSDSLPSSGTRKYDPYQAWLQACVLADAQGMARPPKPDLEPKSGNSELKNSGPKAPGIS